MNLLFLLDFGCLKLFHVPGENVSALVGEPINDRASFEFLSELFPTFRNGCRIREMAFEEGDRSARLTSSEDKLTSEVLLNVASSSLRGSTIPARKQKPSKEF